MLQFLELKRGITMQIFKAREIQKNDTLEFLQEKPVTLIRVFLITSFWVQFRDDLDDHVFTMHRQCIQMLIDCDMIIIRRESKNKGLKRPFGNKTN